MWKKVTWELHKKTTSYSKQIMEGTSHKKKLSDHFTNHLKNQVG